MDIAAAVPSLGGDGGASQPADPEATDADEEDEEVPISVDELFHVVQNPRRRAVLRYLQGREGPVRMRDVAEQVAAREHDTPAPQLTSRERKRVYVALYQDHLDTPAEADLLEYDKSRGIIEPRPSLDCIASYVEMDLLSPPDADEGEDPLPDRYLGAAVVATLLLVGTALDLPVVELFSGFAASILILLLFTVLTVAKLTLDGGRAV